MLENYEKRNHFQFTIHNVHGAKKKSSFQNPLITATEENKNTFDCNIVNNNFNDTFNDENTPSKDN